MTNPRKILMVLGMHRSGTSAFARSMRVLGANLSDRFLEPREDNPKGFWEDADIRQMHFDMREAFGVAWDRLASFTQADIAKLEALGFGEKADDLLRAKTQGGGLYAFKYPPMAKFFPFWAAALARGGYDVRYLLAIRHPLSVAKSLGKRDGMDKEYACLLMLAHILPALSHIQAGTSVVADYDRLMEDPAGELGRIAEHLHLEVDPRERDEFLKNFLTPHLRHSSFSLEDLESDRDLDPLVSEVYRNLLDFAADRRDLADPEVAAMFSKWHKEFDAKTPLLGLIERTTAERDRLTILLDNADKELAWRDASLSWRLTRPLREFRTWASTPRHPGHSRKNEP